MRKEKAQITVLLSLVSLLVFALIAVTLESARAACLRFLMGQAADSAAESVFAAYDSDLLEDYGLMLRRGRAGDAELLSSEAAKYLRYYLEPDAGTLLRGSRAGLLSLTAREDFAVYVTEGGGRIFTDAVLEYMRSAGLGVLAQETLDRLGVGNGNGLEDLGGTLQSFLGSDTYSLDDILGDYSSLKHRASQLLAELEARAEAGELLPGTEEDFGAPAGEETEAPAAELSEDLLEELKRLREQGLLYFLTAGGLSPNVWTGYHASDLGPEEKYRHMNYAASDFSLDERLLLCEYMMKFFSCYTQQKENGQRYEAEYVLAGGATEQEALEAVCGRLLLIRTGFNLAYLYTDSGKQAAAEAAALAAASALMLPELTQLLKPVLLAAWAAAEAVVDVRALLQGKRVPLWKNRGSWKLQTLSLEAEASGGFSMGLSYRDYLRLLFFLRAGETSVYRMMDVIEARMRLLDPAFALREYTVCASFSFTAVMPYLYLQYPFFRRLTGAGEGRKYMRTALYGY